MTGRTTQVLDFRAMTVPCVTSQSGQPCVRHSGTSRTPPRSLFPLVV
jgi:hypothetical protein